MKITVNEAHSSFKTAKRKEWGDYIDDVVSTLENLDYEHYDAKQIAYSYDKALKYMYNSGINPRSAGYFIEEDLDRGGELYRNYRFDDNFSKFIKEIDDNFGKSRLVNN